jgi:DNA-binding response OmpR family regulator
VPKRILVVEDDVMFRNALVAALAQEKYEVLEACSPAEAMQVSDTFEGVINLLIGDRSLKTAAGRRMAERILESRAELRILRIFDRGTEAEAALEKPFLQRNLADDVRRILEQSDKE